MKFCPNCGKPLKPSAKFCPKCGYRLHTSATPTPNTSQPSPVPTMSVPSTPSATNQFVTSSKAAAATMKLVFSQVFQKHSQAEAEEIFIAGTQRTTPALSAVKSDWGRPWLFARVFALFAISFCGLLFVAVSDNNALMIPGVILTGAFAVPLSALVFFFEMNAYKNISFYETLKVFVLGSVLSLLVTMFLYQFVSFSAQEQYYGTFTWGDTISIGIAEELGKVLIVAYFVKKSNYSYILNGMLIGAAIGAGFAAFETAGYIYNAGDELLDVALLRAITATGSHVVWTAITGAALVAVKRNAPLDGKTFFQGKFLGYFAAAIALHAVWDKATVILDSQLLTIITVTIVGWALLYNLMGEGLAEIQARKQGMQITSGGKA
ncbi:PrsW family glutamic-type intramembrane protease [Lacticaseibacillus absianus]|uniref:PrsW family glutamic-type intramembrane protease n=1 Tax=Lacticaseibacillus absianus TaxID=2729623 RepID=UPI0015CBD912|nr:PrsW family intramembrane metalloprotease [Lacticaseibacillus absianus]